MYFTLLNKETNLSSETVKWSLFLWLTYASKSEDRPYKNFTLFR